MKHQNFTLQVLCYYKGKWDIWKKQFCSLPFAEAYHGNAEVQRRVLVNLMDWWDSYFSARSKLCKMSQEGKENIL